MKEQRNILGAVVMLMAILLFGCGKKADDMPNISFKSMVETEKGSGRDAVQDDNADEGDMQLTEDRIEKENGYSGETDKYQDEDYGKTDGMFSEIEKKENVLRDQDTVSVTSDNADIQQASFRWETGENEDSKGAELLLWVDESNDTVGIEGNSWAGINMGEFSGLAVAMYEDGTLEFMDENGNTLLVSPLEDGGIYVEESGITGGVGTTFTGTYQPVP